MVELDAEVCFLFHPINPSPPEVCVQDLSHERASRLARTVRQLLGSTDLHVRRNDKCDEATNHQQNLKHFP